MVRSSVLAASGLLAASAAAGSETDCVYALEIIQLQDASDSFKDDLQNMKTIAPQLYDELAALYPGMKYGLSTFVDKPLPMRGYGAYGGFQEIGIQYDYCYQSMTPMTTDANAYKAAIDAATVGSGSDYQEGQLEAILRCALDTTGTGYSDPSVVYDASGRPIVRVMIIITDATPHVNGDARGAIDWFWDYPRSDKGDGTTTGGFGADDFIQYPCINDQDKYKQIVPFYKRMDKGETLTGADLDTFNTLLNGVGPSPWPVEIKDHPGDDRYPCDQTEYPTSQQVGNALAAKNIYPVILLASTAGDPSIGTQCQKGGYSTNYDECLQQIWTDTMKDAGVPCYIAPITAGSSDIVSAITAAVGSITQEVCLGTTMPPATMPATVATTSTASGGGAGGSTTPHTTSPTGTAAAAAGGSSGGGVPIGPIAGAAAGAAVAAAGAWLAYKKWGAGGLKKAGADTASAPQVDTAEEPVEREALEEVTMEMFQ